MIFGCWGVVVWKGYITQKYIHANNVSWSAVAINHFDTVEGWDGGECINPVLSSIADTIASDIRSPFPSLSFVIQTPATVMQFNKNLAKTGDNSKASLCIHIISRTIDL